LHVGNCPPAQDHIEDHRARDECSRKREEQRDEQRDKRALAGVADPGGDNCGGGEAGQQQSLRPTDAEHEAGGERREEMQPTESVEHGTRPGARALARGRWSQANPVGEPNQRECEQDLERRPQIRVATPARPGGGNADGHEDRTGQSLCDHERGAECERLQPAGR
jgi:hypothetical protein